MWIELLLEAAWAGACCAGTMTTTPARLGECERVAVATTFGAEHALARWDGEGRVGDASPAEEALVGSLSAGWRWSRDAQLQLTAPLRWSWRSTPSLSDAGGGLGDVGVSAIWDPLEEGKGPVPVLVAGVRLPTGRAWKRSESPLLADVTGLPGPAARLGATLERTLPRVPYSLGADLETGPASPLTWGAHGAIGYAFDSDWSASAGLRYSGSFVGEGTRKSTLSAQVVRGERSRWRAWGGAAVDLPVAGLGRHQTAAATASLGLAVVR